MIHRHCFARWSGAISIATSAALFAGCSAAPAAPIPTPTPTFANKEEAFTAAEETYRAYNDALNHVDLTDPHTFEALYALSSGDFEASDRKTLSELHADGYTFAGEITVRAFSGISANKKLTKVVAGVCVDVSDSDVLDRDGASVVPATRPAVNPLRVTFLWKDGTFTINRADRDEEVPCD